MKRNLEIPKYFSEDMGRLWVDLVPTLYVDTPAVVIESLCTQIKTLRDARALIEKDGIVVSDAKNNAVPHPALGIERLAVSEVTKLSEKWCVREME